MTKARRSGKETLGVTPPDRDGRGWSSAPVPVETRPNGETSRGLLLAEMHTGHGCSLPFPGLTAGATTHRLVLKPFLSVELLFTHREDELLSAFLALESLVLQHSVPSSRSFWILPTAAGCRPDVVGMKGARTRDLLPSKGVWSPAVTILPIDGARTVAARFVYPQLLGFQQRRRKLRVCASPQCQPAGFTQRVRTADTVGQRIV